MIKGRKRTKNNIQNILNSKNDITREAISGWDMFVALDWNKLKKDFPCSVQVLYYNW